MTPILHKGFTRIMRYPNQDAVMNSWVIILRTNEDLLEAMEYCHEKQRLVDELGEFFLHLTKKMGESEKWKLYTCIEDMKSYAVLMLCNYGLNFNPDKSLDPISYFIQIAHQAFRQYLNHEHKQWAIKEHILDDISFLESTGIH